MDTDLNRHFSDDDRANKHMKRGSISVIIRAMQRETTIRYHLIPIMMAII